MKKLLYILLFVPLAMFGQSFLSIEQDIPLELQEGWNLFGFTCLESINVINAFSVIEESIIIAKDNDGNAYLPEWDYNGIGDLEYSRGYQIKLTQEITDFQFCPAIIPLVDTDGDGVYDDDEIEGCMDISACNYNELATDIGVCEFPTDGFDCEGNELPEYEVGDSIYGGVLFYIDEDNQYGLVYGNDIGVYEWGCYQTDVLGADGFNIGSGFQNTEDIINENCQNDENEPEITASKASVNYDVDGYDDWYLPSIEELELIPLSLTNTWYWSSTEYDYVDNNTGWSWSYTHAYVHGDWAEFALETQGSGKQGEYNVIPIRRINLSNGSTYVSCPYDLYLEYDSGSYVYDVSLCSTIIEFGCTDDVAENFDIQANADDGSCDYIIGCTDLLADNYNIEATQDDGSCILLGCMDEIADNYNPQANQEDGSCIYLGCMNPTADNYDVQVNQDDGSCIIYGCTLADFPNYNSEATIDDFSCDMSSADVFGCTDPSYLEYDPSVNQDNGTCSVLVVYGCTGPDHCNYNPEANTDDGSCVYPQEGYDCYGNQLPSIGALINGGIVFYIDETGEHGLVAAMEDLEGTYEWGCYGIDLNGNNSNVSPELDGIGTGLQNTLEKVAGCSETPIAASEALAYESEGYNDWFLPSKDELLEMYNTIGNGGPEGNVGGFQDDLYWSSSELSNVTAWYVNFSKGYANSYLDKSNAFRVRAIRSF